MSCIYFRIFFLTELMQFVLSCESKGIPQSLTSNSIPNLNTTEFVELKCFTLTSMHKDVQIQLFKFNIKLEKL